MDSGQRRYQIFLRSSSGPINVYLVSSPGEDDDNVADGDGGLAATDASAPSTTSTAPGGGDNDWVQPPPVPAAATAMGGAGLVRFPEPPEEPDYFFSLDEKEGISDFYG